MPQSLMAYTIFFFLSFHTTVYKDLINYSNWNDS